MYIYDGDKQDKFNKKSDEFIEVNSCGIQHLTGGAVVRKKGRVDYHIVLVGKGEMNVKIGGDIKRIVAGELFVYYPNEEQYYESEKGAISYWMHISGRGIGELLDVLNIESGLYNCHLGASVFKMFSKVVKMYTNGDEKRDLNCVALRCLSLISEEIKTTANTAASNDMWNVATYIDMNFNKELNLKFLADMSGYSRSRFAHLFKDKIGLSPMEYQKNLRLSNAELLLRTTDAKIGDISKSCGYDDALYFCRIFRRKHAISPSEYRNSVKN